MIYFSELALREIKRLQSSRNKENFAVRIGIKEGGCADWYYVLDFDSQINETDHQFENDGLCIVVDPQSYSPIEDLKLDFSEDLMGGGFRFHNPNATKTCSCGQSFSVVN